MASALACLSDKDRKVFARRCRARLAVLIKDQRSGMVTGVLVDVRGWGGRTDQRPTGAREAEDLLAVTMWAVSSASPFDLPHQRNEPDLRRGSEAERALERELWTELAQAAGADPETARVTGLLAPAWPGDSPEDWAELLTTARSAASD